MSKVAVIGGGAAGMMAACAAAEKGHRVTLFEQNEKLGKKLYITGKGRCNLTNACEKEELFQNFVRNGKFLYSSVCAFDNFAVMEFFRNCGLRLKTERGNRVFPASDHSSDVIRALERRLAKDDVAVCLGRRVTELICRDGAIAGIRHCGGNTRAGEASHFCDAVIVASGGASYPSTGSDGSGWKLCGKAGHTVTDIRPALVPMTVKEDYIRELQGLSLKNITFSVRNGKKTLFREFGELLFTHFGISGPVVLTASSRIADKYLGGETAFEIDLKPALSEEQLDARIRRDFGENSNRQFKNSLSALLPAKLIPVMIALSGIDPEKKVNSVTREERKNLLRLLKHFPGTITGLSGFQEAVITRGGIPVKEVNPSTMESKLLPGLYLCGEMLDVDALTGGFNLQIAWSTGYLAGISIP